MTRTVTTVVAIESIVDDGVELDHSVIAQHVMAGLSLPNGIRIAAGKAAHPRGIALMGSTERMVNEEEWGG